MQDYIQIHSVDLGISAPRLSNARLNPEDVHPESPLVSPQAYGHKIYIANSSNQSAEFDLTYTDTLSVSLSTSYLFNYPMSSFARLPVSLTISLSIFNSSVCALLFLPCGTIASCNLFLCQVILTPPSLTSPAPVLTITIPPDFTLDLKTTSLMGSRAKLADVPKLHELIQHQVRRTLAANAIWKVVLPGLGSVAEAKQEIREELARGDTKS